MAISARRAGDGSVGPASDQFSFGVILYEMLSRRRAFARATPAEKLEKREVLLTLIRAQYDQGLNYFDQALSYVNEGGMCDAKFDGKDYPATGSMWPSGWTCSVSKAGDFAFDVTWKKDGKGLYKSSFTVSGKTLTESSTPMGSTEKVKIVYDKQ